MGEPSSRLPVQSERNDLVRGIVPDVGATEIGDARPRAPEADDLFLLHAEFGIVLRDFAYPPETQPGEPPCPTRRCQVEHRSVDAIVMLRDILEMRRKMLAGHPNRTPLFDLKHDPGGMVDVEFTVQYLVLAHSAAHAELTRNAGNIALLDIAARLGLVDAGVAGGAADAYRTYRRRQHQLRLHGAQQARVPPAEAAAGRERVTALWTAVFGAPWRETRS